MKANLLRIILITGASKGLGCAAADCIAQQGHSVIGMARNSPKDPFPGKFITVAV